MKLFITILLGIITAHCGYAQNNLQLQYGYRGTLSAAKFFPSTLNLKTSKYQVGMNFKVWVANKSLSYGSVNDIRKKNELTEGDINRFIGELDQQNIIGVGQDFQWFGFALRKRIRSKKVDLSFAINDRMSASFRYPKALLQLAWRGNKQFEGKQVNLAASLNARYFREFALGTAFDIFNNSFYRIRVGGTLKYYQGLAAIYMPVHDLFFETGNEGDYLEVDYNYNVFYSGVEDYSFTKSRGGGFGANLGTTVAYKERLFLDLSLNDLGSITFKNDVQSFQGNDVVRFSGLNREDLNDIENYADSMATIFENKVVEGGNFKLPIGTRLFVQLLYKFKKDNWESNRANLYLTLVKGFEELPGVTKEARVSIGYNRRVFRGLFLGSSASYGGFNNLAIGALLSVKTAKYSFGIHSDDFTGAVFPSLGTGAGFGFVLQRYFR